MASLRPYWKGYLKLSLVNIAVELYSATASSGKISLNMIHKPSGKRIRYQKIVDGGGPVKSEDIVKGYDVGDDEYVLLTDEELDEIKLESRRTINLVQFVDQCEIDPRYFDKPYYVVPSGNEVAQEGFAVIVRALRDAKKTALGQLSARGRDYIVAIRPCGPGLLAETLRYADEVRASDTVFSEIPKVKIDKEMAELASELIERRSGPFKPEAFKSGYHAALKKLIQEKQKKGTVSAQPAPKETGDGKVVDLMEALRKSLADEKKKPKKSAAKRAPVKRTRAA